MSRTALSWTWAAAIAAAGCAKLVGITETEVTRNEASPDAGLSVMGGSGGASGAPGLVRGAPGLGGSAGSIASDGGVAGLADSAGSAGMAPAAGSDAGPARDAGSLACTEQATRCGPTGRELCNGGDWQPQPCAPDQPVCEGDGQCVLRGPALVSVGGSFFIQATEVTVAQYDAFLTAKGSDTSGQSEVCSWNQSYWDYDAHPVMQPADEPIAFVDWCDAAAYCSWAGLRLCGRIGGGPIARADLFDPALNQWYVACGGPNGGTHPNDDPTCNSTQGFGSVAPVASFPGCEGYFPGLFDMEGNVAEWVDGCDGATGPGDICYLMGGNIIDQRSYCDEVYADAEDAFRRDDKAVTFGFRCCSR